MPLVRQTVLVVDDEAAITSLLREVLEGAGYNVLGALDGWEALKIAEGHDGPIHALLTDIAMPGMNGRELSERLSRQRPSMRVVYMSALTTEAVVCDYKIPAGAPFIVKPFTISRLVAKLQEVLAPSPFARRSPDRAGR